MAKKPKKKEAQKPQGPVLQKGTKSSSSVLIYPVWAKVTVTLAAASCIALAAFFTASMQSCVSAVRQATEPVSIAANLKRIAKIDKLPPGFNCQMAASIFQVSLVTLSYEPDQSTYILWVVPDAHKSARQLVDDMAATGIPNLSDPFDAQKRGQLPVAGQVMEYCIGVAKDKLGQSGCGFVGCSTKKDKRALAIFAWTPGGAGGAKAAGGANGANETTSGSASNGVSAPGSNNMQEKVSFNMDAINSLLSSIKDF